jgi:hypothetical protein
MIVIVAVLIVATVAIAAIVMAPMIAQRKLVFEASPDAPCPFGPGIAWLAVKCDDPLRVAEALGLHDLSPSNWNSGVGTAYDPELGVGRVFVTPPVDGWVFAIGAGLPLPQGAGFVDKHSPMMLDLAARFPDVQFFAAFSELDYFAWCRSGSGRSVRAFAISDSGIVLNRGRSTREERALGLKLYELRGVRGRRGDAGGELLMHPTEEHVMRLAGHWSVNPTHLATWTGDQDQAGSTRLGSGYVGLQPAEWRSERLRKSA